jgi:hypothetical protein
MFMHQCGRRPHQHGHELQQDPTRSKLCSWVRIRKGVLLSEMFGVVGQCFPLCSSLQPIRYRESEREDLDDLPVTFFMSR